MQSVLSLLASLILLGCGLACRMEAQAARVELRGVIRDGSGLGVAGAEVSFTHRATGYRLATFTDEEGRYHLFGLSPGLGDLRVSASAFAPVDRSGISLSLGEQLILDITLTLSDRRESLSVTAATGLLEVSRGTVSKVVDQQRIVTLPLDGRNFVPLVALAPGVALPPNSTLPRINGSRPRVSEYIYDGISVLQPEPGQVAYFPVIDAIEEFRVETSSYSAEYGRANGGVIIVNQKSGSNTLHGTLFEFFRHEALNARNLFASGGAAPRFRRNQYGFVLGGPVQRQKTFFFVDWQGSRQSTGLVRISTVPLSTAKTGRFSVPVFDPATTQRTTAGYSRQPFAGDTIPASRFDSATSKVLHRYPAPNQFSASGAELSINNYHRRGNEAIAQDQFDTRLDRYFGTQHRLFGRYAYLRNSSDPPTPLPDGSGNITSLLIGRTLTRADSVVAEHNWTFSPRHANQLRFGFTRRDLQRRALRTGQSATAASGIPGLPESAFADVLPTYDVVGYQTLGPPASSNADFTTSVTQLIDQFTWIRGRHSIKAGTDIRVQRLDILQPPSPNGNFQFSSIATAGLTATGTPLPDSGNSIASFLTGHVQQFQIDVQREILKPRASIAEFYLQDDMRVTSRLSLNLGVRYTLNVPSTVSGNRSAVFNLRTQQLDFAGRDGTPRAARNLEWGNFGPRLGLAWKLTDASALRAGYGLTWIEQAGITTPFTAPMFPFIRTLSQASLDNIQPAFILSQGPGLRLTEPNRASGLGQGVFGVQRDQKSGYAQQWNISLQKTWRLNWSAELGYLGSKLTNLGVPDVNLNQLTVAQLATGPALTQTVINPFFGQIPAESSLGLATIARQQLLRPYPRFAAVTLYRNNVGHSTYHSFQARLDKRFSAGFTWGVAYTLSKLIDDAGAVFDSAILTGPVAAYQAADSFNRRLEKDVSTGNVPHVLTSSLIWDLPVGRGRTMALQGWKNILAGGWQVAAIIRAQSGSPVAVTQQPNLNAFAGFGIQRPQRLRNPDLSAAQRSTSRWFDTSAFSAAPQFSLGNSSRNPVRGPGFSSVDLMASKTFQATSRIQAEFRVEAFNATNSPQLGPPNGALGTVAFGSITSAFDPRVYELVCKVKF